MRCPGRRRAGTSIRRSSRAACSARRCRGETRDGLGRVVAETVDGRRIESTYDCRGNRTARRNGARGAGARLVESAYDPLGARVKLTIGANAPLELACAAAAGRKRRRAIRSASRWRAGMMPPTSGSPMPRAACHPSPRSAATTPGTPPSSRSRAAMLRQVQQRRRAVTNEKMWGVSRVCKTLRRLRYCYKWTILYKMAERVSDMHLV